MPAKSCVVGIDAGVEADNLKSQGRIQRIGPVEFGHYSTVGECPTLATEETTGPLADCDARPECKKVEARSGVEPL